MNNSLKIYLLTLVCFIAGTSEFVIVGVLDKIAESTNISVAAAGQLISIFAFTAAIGTPVAIYFMRKINQRKVLLIALSTFVLGCVMMIFAPVYELLLISRVFMALGSGVFNVICFIVAAKLAPENKKASAIGTVTIGYNAALIVGLPIGRLVTEAFGWKSIFIGTSGATVILMFLLYRALPAFEGDGAVSFRQQLGLLKERKVLLNLAMSFFWILGYAVFYAYITPFLMENSRIGEELLSVAFLCFGLATLVGNKSGGWIGDRFGFARFVLGSMFFNLFFLVLLSVFIGNSPYLTIVILVSWAMVVWSIGPMLRFNVMSISPNSQGVILSLYNSTIQFGFATGAALGGLEIKHLPSISLSWTAAAMAGVSLLIAYFNTKGEIRLKERIA